MLPEVGQLITVELPDERTRAEIIKVISETAVLAKISQFTTASKSHPYKKGDVVGAQLKPGNLGQIAWIAVDERPTVPRPETIAALGEADVAEQGENI